jgi:signal transduction histidine kinase
VSRTLARTAAVGVLILCLASVTVSTVVSIAVRDRITPGTVVVVGDINTPDMRVVRDELGRRAEAGNSLTNSLNPNLAWTVIVLLVLMWIGVGVMIVWRQPANWAGWLFIITGVPLPLGLLTQAVVIPNLKAGGSFPLTGLFAWAGEYALWPAVLLPLLFLLYPDGHPPTPRWRWAAAGLVGGSALSFVTFLFRPGPFNNWRDDGIVYENPFGIHSFTWGGPLIAIGTIVSFAAALSTIVAVIQRFRRSSGEVRQQMRVLALVAALAGVWTAAAILLATIAGDNTGGGIPGLFAVAAGLAVFTLLLGIPAAYLIAIYRYGLWDLDVVIRKARVALGITFLIGVPAVLILAVVSQVLLWDLAPKPITLVGGVALGLLLIPLFRVARHFAARVTYGKRATPYEVLAEFSDHVGETYAADDVLARMAQVLAAGTGATQARVLLKIGGELREAAAYGKPDGEEHSTPVRFQGEELGVLAVTMPASDPMDQPKERLVHDLATQAGPVLHNVRLIEELRASRQRLVSAQDEERRKIERNLHDGAQQQLVALSVQVKLARTILERDPAKAAGMLDAVQGAAGEALEELRDLARGIYPPLLADQGLTAALEAQARKSPIPVSVDGDGMGRYGQNVEAAVYFCALEALQNVAKYAGATAVNVRLSATDGNLTFEVVDDGTGFDPASTAYGTGLQGMADRLEAIGGRLKVTSAPGAGTTITGRVRVAEVVR